MSLFFFKIQVILIAHNLNYGKSTTEKCNHLFRVLLDSRLISVCFTIYHVKKKTNEEFELGIKRVGCIVNKKKPNKTKKILKKEIAAVFLQL